MGKHISHSYAAIWLDEARGQSGRRRHWGSRMGSTAAGPLLCWAALLPSHTPTQSCSAYKCKDQQGGPDAVLGHKANTACILAHCHFLLIRFGKANIHVCRQTFLCLHAEKLQLFPSFVKIVFSTAKSNSKPPVQSQRKSFALELHSALPVPSDTWALSTPCSSIAPWAPSVKQGTARKDSSSWTLQMHQAGDAFSPGRTRWLL